MSYANDFLQFFFIKPNKFLRSEKKWNLFFFQIDFSFWQIFNAYCYDLAITSANIGDLQPWSKIILTEGSRTSIILLFFILLSAIFLPLMHFKLKIFAIIIGLYKNNTYIKKHLLNKWVLKNSFDKGV